MKVMTLVSDSSVQASIEALLEEERRDLSPRRSLYPIALNSVHLDRRYFRNLPRRKRAFYGIMPFWAAQIIECYLQREKYDAVISWAESLTIAFAALLKLTSTKYPHVALVYSISKKKKAWLLGKVSSHVDRLILWTSTQRDFASQRLGFEPSKVVFTGFMVDQLFYRPMDVKADMICSAGREMRDYGTLVMALSRTSIRCHIAAAPFPGKKDRWVKEIQEMSPLPENVTLGPMKDLADLRGLYARSRFIVLPLLENETDSGTTVILEAMAMGKAVICSRTNGQRDFIEDGRNGIYVRVGDVGALREAIEYLWQNPQTADAMGRYGRECVERRYTLDAFVENVKRTVTEVLVQYRADTTQQSGRARAGISPGSSESP